ncbi:MAG: endonuclease/exonuclease/phosphatase family protein [Candidatus Competibacteraceae bacterium]
MSDQGEPRRLRLLSYNIQSGLTTRKYSQYFTRSWKHLVPVPSRMSNLDGIARVLTDYDLVGLQEVDAGSLRSGFVNQVKYLADYAGFEYMFDQSNRRIGMISQHGNAVLSRIRPTAITEHKLPGLIPGRGVLEVRFGAGKDALHVLIVHMALGRRGRLLQIEFLANLMRDYRHIVLMGDLSAGRIARRYRDIVGDGPSVRAGARTANLSQLAAGPTSGPYSGVADHRRSNGWRC